jgi:xanthosine utilization system XapX-like protein
MAVCLLLGGLACIGLVWLGLVFIYYYTLEGLRVARCWLRLVAGQPGAVDWFKQGCVQCQRCGQRGTCEETGAEQKSSEQF